MTQEQPEGRDTYIGKAWGKSVPFSVNLHVFTTSEALSFLNTEIHFVKVVEASSLRSRGQPAWSVFVWRVDYSMSWLYPGLTMPFAISSIPFFQGTVKV